MWKCINKTRLMCHSTCPTHVTLSTIVHAIGYLFPANCASPTSCTLAPSLASSTAPDAWPMASLRIASFASWTQFKGFSMAAPQMHPICKMPILDQGMVQFSSEPCLRESSPKACDIWCMLVSWHLGWFLELFSESFQDTFYDTKFH